MITPLLTTPLFAFLASVFLHIVAMRIFPKLRLLDFPERYNLRRGRLPYPTGLLTAFLCICLFSLFGFSLQNIGIILAILSLTIVNALDDRVRLSPLIRLFSQIVAAVVIFLTGSRIYTLTNPLADFGLGEFLKLDAWTITLPELGPLPIMSGVFTIVWLLLTMNAMNWFDGIPGQTSLLSFIGFLTIGFLSLSSRVNQPELALLAFSLAGLSAASSLFELPLPFPKVVPGDSGAMLLGLLLGLLTIYTGGKVATGFLVLGVPLIDSALVIIRRILSKSSPMKGSTSGEHLHHRLLEFGWTQWQVIAGTTLLGACFGITALFLSTFGKAVAALLLGILITVLSLLPSFYARKRKT